MYLISAVLCLRGPYSPKLCHKKPVLGKNGEMKLWIMHEMVLFSKDPCMSILANDHAMGDAPHNLYMKSQVILKRRGDWGQLQHGARCNSTAHA